MIKISHFKNFNRANHLKISISLLKNCQAYFLKSFYCKCAKQNAQTNPHFNYNDIYNT